MQADGYTILRGVLSPGSVEEARLRCLSELSAHNLWFGGGTIAGHIAYSLPPDLDIIAKLITNPAVLECASEILGSDFHVLSIGCNVNLPGSWFQPAHADGRLDCNYLGLNLPLGNVTEENGSLEVFAGTHRASLTYAGFRRVCGTGISRRANTSSGDVIVRYPNVWHRGTPNGSTAPRFMIATLLGRQSTAQQPLQLSPRNIEVLERAGVRASLIPTDATTGSFHPTYFQRTPQGILKELIWRYTPAVYNLIRRLQ